VSALGVQQVQGGEGERGERLVEGEVGLQRSTVTRTVRSPLVGLVELLHHAGVEEGSRRSSAARR
jgi:hypothetical protein